MVRGPTGNLKTMIELGPKLRSTAVMEASKPVRIAATPMMVPVPMITPEHGQKGAQFVRADGLKRQHQSVEESQSGHGDYCSTRRASMGSSRAACRAG